MVVLPILISTILGYLSGLGIGGGSLLILWLTSVMSVEARAARAINLMFFIVTAAAVSIFRLKKGCLDIRGLIPGVLAGCVSAAVFSWLSVYLDTELLKKLFGGLLIATGIKELLYRPRKLR